MRVRIDPKQAGYRLYVRFDPTVNGNGGGGVGNGGADSATIDRSTGHPVLVASDPNTATNAANRDYAQPVYAALDGTLTEATSGFVGAASDGLVQLDASHGLTRADDEALGGNVVQTARVAVGQDGKAMLALGFGASQAEAVATASASLARPFDEPFDAYKQGWKRYDESLNKPRTEKLGSLTPAERKRLEDEYYLSANVLKASEDKTFPGAIVASLASPWGQAVSAGDPANTYFGSYREVFARDLYETWTGLVAAGDLATARAATLFLFERQQLPDGSMPRNSLVNGKTRARLVRDAAGRGRVPDPDGPAARAHGRLAVRGPHQAGRELPDLARPRVRRPSAGRSRAASRPRRSRPRSQASPPRPTSLGSTATRPRPPSGSASPTTGSARSRAGR